MKYNVAYKNGKKGLYEIPKEDKLLSVLENLIENNVKSITIAGFELKINKKSIEEIKKTSVIFSYNNNGKEEEFFTSVDNNISLEELKKQANLLDRNITTISIHNKKIDLKDLTEENLKNYLNNEIETTN